MPGWRCCARSRSARWPHLVPVKPSPTHTRTHPLPAAQVAAILQGVADEISSRYNCSVALAFCSEGQATVGQGGAVAVASGYTDAGLGMGTYVWGSITKMFTGPAILWQLGPVMDMSKAGSIKCFDEEQARTMFRQLVLAVEFIHAQGIIHRDIKPSNLLLYVCAAPLCFPLFSPRFRARARTALEG